VFDFVGDVGVDVVDAVGEFVAEAAGLRDVGDGVGDHPGLVPVPEAVDGQAGADRPGPQGGVAALVWPQAAGTVQRFRKLPR